MQYLAALLACPAFLALAPTAAALQMTTTRVSVDSASAQGNAASSGPFGNGLSIDAAGRFVAFRSEASNLAAGDTNGFDDIFVRDGQGGTTERVSVDSGGAQGNSHSDSPSISADARFVAFRSDASNLVASDTNGFQDVFVRDRQGGTTERVSVATGGAQGNSESRSPSISADGRFVAFWSSASNLVAGDTNTADDVFVRDRTGGTTERVSVATGGAQGNSLSFYGSISADGRYVAFGSGATNLVAGDTNGYPDVFVHDRTSGATERASVDTGGVEGNNDSVYPSISADSHFVAFWSRASNLVAGDTNGFWDVFVHDRTTGTTERVSVATSGAQATSNTNPAFPYPSCSADGRFVAFNSDASNLVAGDTNGYCDTFVRDRQSAATERVSMDTAGAQGNSDSGRYGVSISADGRFVAFPSYASNLVAGDTNNTWDAFVRDRGPLPPSVYCTAGTTTNGCNASMAASANPSVSLGNACNITVTNIEGQKSGILFYGINNTGFTPGPWASGSTSLKCVKNPTQRTPIQNSGGTINVCDGLFVLDWNAYQVAHPLSLGNPWSVGAKVYAQTWFRDPPAPKSTNLSNALEMTYVP